MSCAAREGNPFGDRNNGASLMASVCTIDSMNRIQLLRIQPVMRV